MECSCTNIISCENISVRKWLSSDFTQTTEKMFEIINLFYVYFKLEKFGISKTKYSDFIAEIEKRYIANPYHNFNHAVDATYSLVILLQNTDFGFSDLEKLSLFVAMIGHDMGHFGRTGQFVSSHVKKITDKFKSVSPLEEFHLSELFEVITHVNLFSEISDESLLKLTEILTSSIIATDPVTTAGFIRDFSDRREEQYNLIIKCADIGASIKVFDVHINWSIKLIEEFYSQGDELKTLGLPLMDLFNSEMSAKIPSGQVWYFENYAIPLYNKLGQHILNMTVLEHLESNCETWRSKIIV